jgi:hypothetical protein
MRPPDLPEPEHDPDEVRELADEILSRPEYREPPRSLFERVNDFLNDLLEGILEAVGLGAAALPAWVAWVVAVGLLAVVGLLVAWVVRAGGWGRGRRLGGGGEPVVVSAEQQRSPDGWLALAEQHEAAGRWRDGVLCRYRSLVTRLVDAGVISGAVGRTTGELVRDVAGHPVSVPFAAATELFEAVWYGAAPAGPGERDRLAGLSAETVGRLRDRDPDRAAQA